jgi:DNA mismatch repair protein MutS
VSAGVEAEERAGGSSSVSRPEALTPLMRQYDRIKRDHRDAILLFRLGDFYEMFNEDAELGAAALDLTLTSRNNGQARRVPLAGFPAKAAETYVSRLLAAGHRVAICEQMEDPRLARGIVRREVVEVVTPGAVVDEALLEATRGNYLAAAALDGERLGLAFADVSTGELWLGEAPPEEAEAELERLGPREVLVPVSWLETGDGGDGFPAAERRPSALGFLRRAPRAAGPPAPAGPAPAYVVTGRADHEFDLASCRERLLEHLRTVTLDGFGIPEDSPAVTAAGAALGYLREVQPRAVATLVAPRWIRREDHLLLDDVTLRNLEVLSTSSGGPTLLSAVDATLTAPGGRLLRAWLLRPLRSREAIAERQDALAFLADRGDARARLRADLRGTADVARIAGRSVAARATPRDLAALRRTLERLPAIAGGVRDAPGGAIAPGAVPPPALLERLAADLEGHGGLLEDLERTLVEEPAATPAEGPVVRDGCDPELDALRHARRAGLDWIAALQKRERERTGIGSLKVGYNRVFGYYIEVTRANLGQVPPDYQRKQTIANGERYLTPELKEVEERVLAAEDRMGALEAEALSRLRERVAAAAPRLQRLAEGLAGLDVIAGLAETAAVRGWRRPEVVDGDALEIRGGRHPVVEAALGTGRFVPNDLVLGPGRRILLLTGPNMAGKSTYLRQAGLLVLLAQAGSFVPAESARIGIVDRVFTRVGASDDLARGRSTFLVEMVETANILRNAGPASLVLLDEIGRGTATFDGLSLAWAVTERLHAAAGGAPRTIFATHYHELTALADRLPGVANAHVQVKEWGDGIVFLKRVEDGRSDRSYGIHVARIAGLPLDVVERAREILARLEAGEPAAGLAGEASGEPRFGAPGPGPARPSDEGDQLAIFGGAGGGTTAGASPAAAPDPLREALAGLDTDRLRPLEALNLLAEWKRRYADA